NLFQQLVRADDRAGGFRVRLVDGGDRRPLREWDRSVQEETLVFLMLGQQLQHPMAQGVVPGTGGVEVRGTCGGIRLLQRFDEDVSFTHGTPLSVSATKPQNRAKKQRSFFEGK